MIIFQNLTFGGTFSYETPNLPPSKYLWSWGKNSYGSLGLGDTANRSSPAQVGESTTWSAIYPNASIQQSSASIFGAKTDGTAWAWGYNAYGTLGTTAGANQSSPVQLGSANEWASFSSGFGHAKFGLKPNGELWAWGQGQNGALGLGNTVDRYSPLQVGALTNWAYAATGRNHTLALKTDGTIWSWGAGSLGRLGLGVATNYSSPKQVGSDTTWLKIAAGQFHNYAIKTDGTLWVWGQNYKGGLGNGIGTATNTGTPTQLGALTDWLQISAGMYNMFAVKTNGTMWATGQGTSGQLGLGGTTNRSSPTQIGALTNWLNVSGGRYHAAAIKTNGTIWAWGSNGFGQLGLGNTTDYASPKQVGVLTSWTTIAATSYSSLAIG
jgi:alpha-tubulin suppressor-like RCC1 family protein